QNIRDNREFVLKKCSESAFSDPLAHDNFFIMNDLERVKGIEPSFPTFPRGRSHFSRENGPVKNNAGLCCIPRPSVAPNGVNLEASGIEILDGLLYRSRRPAAQAFNPRNKQASRAGYRSGLGTSREHGPGGISDERRAVSPGLDSEF